MAKIQKKSKQQFHLIPFFYFPPKDCPSGSHQTIFPQKPQNPETTDGEYPPTDCTDIHRLGGYGIPAIPTQPPNYLPTEFTEHTETTGGEENLCTSVKSVGGSYLPEGSVGSACSVGGSYLKLCWCSRDCCTPWCYCKPFTSSIGKPEP